MAVIFVNKLDKEGKATGETTGLCIECAKKQGIDPLSNVMKEMENMSEEDLNNMTNQFNSLLSFDVDQLIKDQSVSSESSVYRINLAKDKISSYDAAIKFIPWHKNPNDSIVQKYVVFMENPTNNNKRYVDCPSTIKERSVLQDAFFMCRESEKANVRDAQKHFRRIQQYFSLIQIVKDKQHPEYEGKIKIFQYGQQVYDKIKQSLIPSSEFKESQNPFDIFKGKLFNLHAEYKAESNGQKFPTYTSSEFLDKSFSILIDGKEATQNDSDKILEFLKSNSPNLEDYKFKEWDDQTFKFVAEAIYYSIPQGDVLKEIMKKHKNVFSYLSDEEVQQISSTSKKSSSKSRDLKDEDITDIIDDDDEDEIIDVDDDDDAINDLDEFVNSPVKSETKAHSKKKPIDDFEEFDI
jgi:hypothetical protein